MMKLTIVRAYKFSSSFIFLLEAPWIISTLSGSISISSIPLRYLHFLTSNWTHEETLKKIGKTPKEKTMIEAVSPLVVVIGLQVSYWRNPIERNMISATRAMSRPSYIFSRNLNLSVR